MPPELPPQGFWATDYYHRREERDRVIEEQRRQAEAQERRGAQQARVAELVQKAHLLSLHLPSASSTNPDHLPQSTWVESGDTAEYDGHTLTCRINLSKPTGFKGATDVVLMGMRWDDEDGVVAVGAKAWLGFCTHGLSMDSTEEKSFIFNASLQSPHFTYLQELRLDSPLLDDAERCIERLAEE